MNWRLRNQRRQQNAHVARAGNVGETKMATVVAVNENGDVQLDRFTDANGVGEWFSPANNVTPEVGTQVAYSYVEGSPMVIGPVANGEGDWQILPGDDMAEEWQGGNDFNFDNEFLTVPKIIIPEDSWIGRFNAPMMEGPSVISLSDHFINGGVSSGAIGKLNWVLTGNGSATMFQDTYHTLRVGSGGSNGNQSTLSLHTPFTSANGSVSLIYPFEMLFLLSPDQATAYRMRWGLLAPTHTDTPSFGYYWTDDTAYSGVRATKAFSGGITMGDAWPERYKTPTMWRMFNTPPASGLPNTIDIHMQMLGDERDGSPLSTPRYLLPNGRYRVRNEHVWYDAYAGASVSPFISIRTLQAAGKGMLIDYFGFCQFLPQFPEITQVA